jgi:hypothetical protein
MKAFNQQRSTWYQSINRKFFTGKLLRDLRMFLVALEKEFEFSLEPKPINFQRIVERFNT